MPHKKELHTQLRSVMLVTLNCRRKKKNTRNSNAYNYPSTSVFLISYVPCMVYLPGHGPLGAMGSTRNIQWSALSPHQSHAVTRSGGWQNCFLTVWDGLCIMIQSDTRPQLSAPNHRGRAHGRRTPRGTPRWN